MICVFCCTEFDTDTQVCSTCNDYKGLVATTSPKGQEALHYSTLGHAINEAFMLMELASQYYQDQDNGGK